MAENARLLERARFAVAFDGAPAEQVARAVAAYQRGDGGLGFALEPDFRVESSQPLFIEMGLLALQEVGWKDADFANRLCGFLSTVCTSNGLVPVVLDEAARHPHASHWSTLPPAGLNPTASLCGLLHDQGAAHPWLETATATCARLLRECAPTDAHTLLCATRFAEHVPDRELGRSIIERVAASLPGASFFNAEPSATHYGLTPLHFAPSPKSALAPCFSKQQLTAHLAQLRARQRADGGWHISWQAPGQTAAAEWAGLLTLEAVRTLAAFDALDGAPHGDV